MRIHHMGFFTPKLEVFVKFYTSKLEFSAGEVVSLPKKLMNELFGLRDSCRMVKLSREDIILEVFEPENTSVMVPSGLHTGCNHWGLAVPDKAEFIQGLKKEGIPIIEFNKNGKILCFVRDPDGNSIEISDAGRKK
ncbi:MAG: VOC family protein [Candidatus Aminicenantes bacterium]|nr:VOC family protein [Candidatus Aminicenantes bacterium]